MAAVASRDGMVSGETKAAMPQLAATAGSVGDDEVANGTSSSTVLQANVMKHNDLQLQELLRLARSCLKYDRLPGELAERGFFDKFDREHAERSKSDVDLQQDAGNTSVSAAEVEELKQIVNLELTPPLEGPDEDPPDVRTLKEQTAQIERAVAEAQQLIEAATTELSSEVLKRWTFEKDEKGREVDLQRSQRQLRLAKDMVKRQNVEIKELHSNLQTLQLAAASTQSAPAAIPTPPPGCGRPKARPAPRLVGRPVGPRARAAALVAEGEASVSFSAPADPPAPPAASTQSGPGAVEQSAVSSVNQPCKQAQRPRESIADISTGIRLPKSRTYEAVLASSNKNSDTWKLYIP